MELMNSNIRAEEITTTLEQIQKVNQMIAYHSTFAEPDQNALDNFQDLRNDFLQQLSELMASFDLEVNWKRVA